MIRHRKLTLVFLLAALGSPTRCASAQGCERHDVSLTCWLSTEAVMQHEPIILHWRITNHTSSAVVIDVEKGDYSWLGLECIGPEGTPLKRIKLLALPRGGLIVWGYEASAGGTYEGQIVFPLMFSISEQGWHTLLINARIPCIAKGQGGTRTIVARERLCFKVHPANAERLTVVMNDLIDKALSRSPNVPGREAAVKALLAMPPSEAASAWRTLFKAAVAAREFVYAGTIMRQLELLATPEAADMLAEIAWGDLSVPDYRTDAKRKLVNIHWGGGAEAKKRVEELFVKHEGKMPDMKGPIIPLQ